MKKTVSLILCTLLAVTFCVCVYAQSQGATVTTSVPQITVTCPEGGEDYTVYYGGNEVDGTTFTVDRNVNFTITVDVADGYYLLHSKMNGIQIYTDNGNGETFTLKSAKATNELSFELAEEKQASFEGVFEKGTKFLASLTLNDNININFAMRNLCSSFDIAKLVLNVDGNDKTFTADSIVNGDFEYILASKTSKKIGENVHCIITYNETKLTEFDYSVAKYCNTILTSSKDYAKNEPKLYNLCKAVLNYGDRAEAYFESDDLITLDAKTKINLEDSAYAVVAPSNTGYHASNVDISKVGANLILESTVTLQFHFSSTKTLTKDDIVIVNNSNQAVNADNITFTDDGGEYTVGIINIGASKLSKTYKLTLKDVSENDFYIYYGVYDYCYAAESKQNESLKMLARAIYAYGNAAKAY